MTKLLTMLIVVAFASACSSDPESSNNGAVDLGGTDSGSTADTGGPGPADIGNGSADLGNPEDLGGGTEDMGTTIEDLGPPPNPLDGVGAVELVQEGFQFTEGPRWYPDENVLRFTDIPANTIFELTEPDSISAFTSDSQGANGLAFDADGNVMAAEHGGRRVSRYENGVATAVVDMFEGQAFNSPNDLVLAADGTTYFTDPPYGLGNRQREISFNGLFRLAPDGSISAEWEGDANATRPNGVVLSPNGDVLYLADTQASKVYAFDVAADGSLSGERDFADAQNPDGMAVDVFGNIYVTASSGVEVFAPDGSNWGRIEFPRQPANCAFGGDDGQTLYVTARQGLYRVRLAVEGIY